MNAEPPPIPPPPEEPLPSLQRSQSATSEPLRTGDAAPLSPVSEPPNTTYEVIDRPKSPPALPPPDMEESNDAPLPPPPPMFENMEAEVRSRDEASKTKKGNRGLNYLLRKFQSALMHSLI